MGNFKWQNRRRRRVFRAEKFDSGRSALRDSEREEDELGKPGFGRLCWLRSQIHCGDVKCHSVSVCVYGSLAALSAWHFLLSEPTTAHRHHLMTLKKAQRFQ